MRRFVKILILLLTITMCFSTKQNKYKENDTNRELKMIREVSLEEEFDDSSIVVVLSNDESKKLLDYSFDSFCDIGCNKIYDLTNRTRLIYNQIKKDDYSFINGENDIRTRLDINNYHRILMLKLEIKSKDNVISVINKLNLDDRIICAEPNYYAYANSLPIEYDVSRDWGLEKINMPNAWNIEYSTIDLVNNINIRIGVLDSGIDGDHEDLLANICFEKCMNFIGTEFDEVNVGTIENPPTDPYSHGTKVAGIIGASANGYTNSAVGVCQTTSLISLKVIDNNGKAPVGRLITALDYASFEGLEVLNCSLGFNDLASVKYAIQNYPGLFVCSAGNDNDNLDFLNHYPGRFVLQNMITVGASTSNDSKEGSSNYGPSTVDLFAPGEYIWTTIPYSHPNHTKYSSFSYTSAATPFVTGTAALILKHNPSLSPFEVKELIIKNVDKVDSLGGLCTSGGRLNAYKALASGFEPKTFMGDVNGDGYEDMIMVRNNDGFYSFYVYNGQSNCKFNTTAIESTTTIVYHRDDDVLTGDFNGDGKIDILIHSIYYGYRIIHVCIGTSMSSIIVNTGLNSTYYFNPIFYSYQCIIANQNGDNYDDFIVIYKDIYDSNSIKVLVYSGKNTLNYLNEAIVYSSNITYKDVTRLLKGDFNGDGYDDLLFYETGYFNPTGYRYLKLLISNNSSTLYESSVSIYSLPTYNPRTNPYSIFVKDTNGDNYDDIVISYKNNYNYRYAFTYLGISLNPYLAISSSNSLTSSDIVKSYYPVIMGDTNGDGRDDIVSIESNSFNKMIIKIYKSNTSSFLPSIDYITPYDFYPNTDTYSCFFADVNGDGKKDIVIKKKYNNQIMINIYKCGFYGISDYEVCSITALYYD